MKFFFILILVLKNFYVSLISCSEMSILKWDQKINNFVLIMNKSDPQEVEERNSRVLQSRLLEMHNFQKAPVRIGYFEEKPIMVTYDNGTKITGIVGEIWNTLSDHLNFTLVLVKSETEIFSKLRGDVVDGVLGILINNSTDIIPNALMLRPGSSIMTSISPYWDDTTRMFIRSEYSSNKSWLLKIFSFNVLLFIIVIMMIFSALGFILENFSNRAKTQKKVTGIQDHIFYTFAAFCSQGSFQKQHNDYKIFEFSRRIFTWFLLLTVSSHLISLMTNTEVKPPFLHLDSLLLRTKYKILLLEGSLIDHKFQSIVIKLIQLNVFRIFQPRILYMKSKAEMYKNICYSKDGEYAVIETLAKRYSKEMKMCKLEPTGRAVEKSWAAAIIAIGFKYKRSFDIGIIRLREVGILSRSKRYLTRTDHEILDSHPTIIEFQHVYGLFIILLLGSSVSVIILIGENIFFWCYQRKKNLKLKQSIRKKRFKKLRRKDGIKKETISHKINC
ncbi:uncharacterized protein LOC123260694 [Cotesia glomerata]|uniref:uncharacterized protein LOC123260694 n=1 Tax=Cotesia glomerata TaxID=32391 RepID=UPI001D01F9E4|nr:uncharacterized protein LOC123260694 [Cotesia glomerata]